MSIQGMRFAGDARRTEGTARPLERGVRLGELVRVRRGAYAVSEEWSGLSAEERHRRRALAFVRSARGRVVFCGVTAAVLLGIPVLGELPDRPMVAVAPCSSSTDRGAIRRRMDVEGDIVVLAGYAVTSPLRTAIDVGAERGPDAAVIALSDVMRRWGITRDAVEEEIRRRRPFRGVRSVAVVVPALSALSETPIESVFMLRFVQLGFELPAQQVEHVVHGRRYRDDFEWISAKVIAEADGRVKYTEPEALWKEKVREDDLRSISRAFLRVYWADLFDRPALEAKLVRAGVPRATPPSERESAD